MKEKPPATSEEVLRMTALQLAINVHQGPSGFPDDIIGHARQFYLFLKQNDPTLDRGLDEADNVIDLFEAAGVENG